MTRESNHNPSLRALCLSLTLLACGPRDAPTPGDDAVAASDAVAAPDESPVEPRDASIDRVGAPPVARDAPVEGGAAGRCALPTQSPLRLPADDVRAALSPSSRIDSSGCLTPTPGGEAIYPFTLAARTGVILGASAGLIPVALSVRRGCEDAGTELVCAASTGLTTAAVRTILDPGAYFVVADARVPLPGAVDLRLRTFTPAPNATCATALALAPEAPRVAQDTDGGVDTEAACGLPGAPRLYYALTVPAFHRAVVTATPRAGSAGVPSIRVVDGCATRRCLTASPPSAAGAPAIATVDHRADTPRTFGLMVGPAAADAAAHFDLSVRFVPLPRHADCAAAMPIASGAVVTAQDLDLADQPPDTFLCGRGAPRALYYAVTLPAGQRLRAMATARSPGGVDVALLGACGAGSCDVDTARTLPDAPRILTHRNTGAAPQRVILAVTGAGVFDLAIELLDPAVNAACATPRTVAGGERLVGEEMLRSGFGPASCYGSGGTTPELYYVASIPPGHTLRAEATPRGPVRWNLAMRVLTTCAAAPCPATATAGGQGAPEVLRYTNRSATAQDAVFAVTSFDHPGAFDLAVDLIAPPTGASCASAPRVAPGESLLGQDLTAGVDNLASACLPLATGPTLYYAVTVPASSTLHAAVTPSGLWNAAIRVFDGCSLGACVASADRAFVDATETLHFVHAAPTPRSVILAVSATASVTRGTFDLRVTATGARPNAACSSATTIRDGTRLVGEEGLAAVDPPTGCITTGGPVLYYTATVPPSSTLRVRVTPTGPTPWDPMLRLLPTCGAGACLVSRNGALAGEPEEALYPNRTGAPESVIVAVGSYDGREPQGTFDLDASVLPAPPNAVCAGATALVPGAGVSGQVVSRGLDSRGAACVPTATGPTLYYALSIPPHSRAVVTARPAAGPVWVPILRVLSSCGATSCLAFADTTAGGNDRVVSASNFGDVAMSAVLAVSSVNVGAGGSFSLQVEHHTLATNAQCTAARALTHGGVALDQDPLGAIDPPSGCGVGGRRGNVLYYTARVPGGATLIVRATPRGPTPWVPAIRFQSSCPVTGCLAFYGSAPPGAEQSVAYATTSAADIVVAIGPDDASVTGPFDVRAAIVPAPTNTACAAATVVTAPGVLRDQIGRGTESLAAACLPTHTGGSVYYRVSVPAGATVVASASPTGAPNWSPAVRVLPSCGAATCLANSRLATVPATYTNTTGAGVDLLVAVSGQLPGTWGAFDLNIDVRR